MYEIVAANFKRGVFELKLEKKLSNPLSIIPRAILAIGPMRGRFIAFLFLGLTLFLVVNPAPARLFLEQGWALSEAEAAQMQRFVSKIILAFAVIFYILVFFFRKPELEIDFDRSRQSIDYFYVPAFRYASIGEWSYGFSEIQKLDVLPAAQKSPHGGLEIELKEGAPSAIQKTRFNFLTDEQKVFFPSNINKISGVEPTGDWSDPDDEPVKLR